MGNLWRKPVYTLLWIGALATTLVWPSSVRVMTYNVLAYNGSDDTKEAALRTVIEDASPDVIMVEELVDQNGYTHFLTDVLNYSQTGVFAGAPFTEQTADKDIGLYYKSDLFTFISTSVVDVTDSWGLRDVVEFVLTHNASGIEIHFYGVHLKASSGSDNEATRAAEANLLRAYLNTLPSGSNFLVMGDFNFYHSGEAGFQILVDSTSDNDGRLFDPVNRIGYWHNNSAFADVHTQSPRANFGGMDDRFDWIFASESILSQTNCNYIPGTYHPFGNDGNHFNMGINEGNNTAVSAAVADALVAASDHIPVVADLEFMDLIDSNAKIVISEIMPNPSTVSDSYGEWFEVVNADTVAYNLNGWTLADAGDDYHVIAPNSGELWIAPGEYLVFGRAQDETTNGGVQVDYEISGFLLSNTEDEIIIYDDQNQLVDIVEYTSAFPFSSGAAMYITDFSADNNDPANWFIATTPYGLGDLGTPGQAWDDPLSVEISENVLPEQLTVFPAYPNPFNPVVTIPYYLGNPGVIRIDIINLAGVRIRSIHKTSTAGFHQFIWDGKTESSGTYFVRIQTGNDIQTQKIVLLK